MREYAAAYREKHGHGLSGNYRRPTTAKHGNSVPRRVRQAIYERDGWVCQLCDEPVDRTLHPNHRLAATLDHVECQSWVLIPDHSPTNLRLVHRACNSRRKDGANDPQEVTAHGRSKGTATKRLARRTGTAA